jgi:MFS superfamily sulfate permease-like transporter
MNNNLIEAVKILVFSSVLFVWVVRYKNIVEEFRTYNYPDWLRDLVGILKISLVVMLMSENSYLVNIGAVGIMILMLAAIITHLRIKNSFTKMLPAMTLFVLSAVIFFGPLA